MKSTKVLLGERIREIRGERKLTQKKLADLSGVDAKHLSKVELGKCYPSFDYLEKLANILKVEIGEFFQFTHLKPQAVRVSQLKSLINNLDEDQKKMIIKIIKAIAT